MLKLDSLYIHRRGFTSSSIINQCYLPPKGRERAASGALTPLRVRALGVRTNTLGNPTIPGS